MTATLDLFNAGTIDDHAFILAKHLPTGKFWEAAFDSESNLGKLVRGLAIEIYRLAVLTGKVSTEMDINQTNELLLEWERSVGIPGSGVFLDPEPELAFPLPFPLQFSTPSKFEGFTTNKSLEDRRTQLLQKFSKFQGVQTAADFVRVAAVFGIEITITAGTSFGWLFPVPFPLKFTSFDEKEVAHIIVVDIIDPLPGNELFPLPFPIPFALSSKSFLKYIFTILAPANVYVIYV